MKRIAALIPPLLFLIAATVVITSGKIPHRVAYDQLLYHSAAISEFAKEWPRVDTSDYLSATTPGFHLFFAWLQASLGFGMEAQQFVCAAITAALLLVLGMVATSSADSGSGAARALVVIPVGASMYIFASGAWILPDNAAWLGVLALLLLTLSRTWNMQRLLLGGAVLAALVFVRQIHLWAGGLLVARAFLEGWTKIRSRAAAGGGGEGGLWRASIDGSVAVLACAPAVLVLLHFFREWHGLVPPSFRFQYHETNFAGPAWLLAVFGVVSVFFSGWFVERVIGAWRTSREIVLAAVIFGMVVAVAPVTTAGSTKDYFAGRRTGLWDIAAKLPQVGGHTSLLIVACAALGAGVLMALVCRWRPVQRLVVLAAFAGYAAALSAGGELWQRYTEPFVLLMIVLMIGLDAGLRESEPGPAGVAPGLRRFASLAGPAALALAFVALNVRDIRKPDTQLVTDPAPPAETPSAEVPIPTRDSPWSRYMISKGRLEPGPAR